MTVLPHRAAAAASRPAPPGNRAECRAVGRGARRGATAADAPRRRARAGGLPRLPGLRVDRPESDGRRRNATAEDRGSRPHRGQEPEQHRPPRGGSPIRTQPAAPRHPRPARRPAETS